MVDDACLNLHLVPMQMMTTVLQMKWDRLSHQERKTTIDVCHLCVPTLRLYLLLHVAMPACMVIGVNLIVFDWDFIIFNWEVSSKL